MNPITIIRERIAESKRREEGVTEGPWIDFAGVLRTKKGLVGVNSMSCQTEESADSKFMAFARTDLPMWRSIAEQLLEALEKANSELMNLQPHIAQCVDKHNRPFIDSHVDRAMNLCDGALTAISQQLAGEGLRDED